MVAVATCAECREGRLLVEGFAELGAEVHVQRFHPALQMPPGGYEESVFRCPKCLAWWWCEPTNDQILDWRNRGVK